ncbi:uncharacterized protein CANTADRAFT_27030 [Suhomyces tanzawaensis NRRL Y-17324]|uniref:Uncharacterized protein n=1 Tax=Suhomyces tanzawaensis NRRL Y-17324 TaxID=984487 RepID=A0A1E4SF41_9ASCO|nr:uncharacterized protein CANTADRAFT_27030 [Suhomyces tanzawaensis NRRL Y-17324]ODV78085.1 hypothetical protein CANTADRAFT_27030 [Suhomyces tanzawaensis NRRL Y-17324]
MPNLNPPSPQSGLIGPPKSSLTAVPTAPRAHRRLNNPSIYGLACPRAQWGNVMACVTSLLLGRLHEAQAPAQIRRWMFLSDSLEHGPVTCCREPRTSGYDDRR